MLPDVILGCLHGAIQDGTPAEGSMRWNPMLRGSSWFDNRARAWELYMFGSGGMGARPSQDGLSTTAFPSGVRTIPTEIAELTSPVMIWRKEYRPDSGGAGRYRGGLGQIVEIGSATEAPMQVQAMFDRVQHPARGREGGGPGAVGVVADAGGHPMRAKGLQSIPAGDRLVLRLPGGGGWGDPMQRSPQDVAADVRAGLVTAGAAAELYGVVVTAEGAVDITATAARRVAASHLTA
jgi:N-methylhydantoinase B